MAAPDFFRDEAEILSLFFTLTSPFQPLSARLVIRTNVKESLPILLFYIFIHRLLAPQWRRQRYAMYAIADQISKQGPLANRISSFDNLVSIVVTNSLGVPSRRSSLTRVTTIVLIRAVVVKYILI